jgi:hypothetical protein
VERLPLYPTHANSCSPLVDLRPPRRVAVAVPSRRYGEPMAAPATPTPTATNVVTITPGRLRNLRLWNLGLVVAHAAQAVAIAVLAGGFAITITSNYPLGPPGTRLGTPEPLFDVRIGTAIAVFLALAAIDHLLTSTVARRLYEADLGRGINRFRWVEYSFSATLMVLLIAAYSGITDITAVVAIAGANAAMILFGWMQERANPPGRTTTTMLPFWFGTLVGLAPWIAIGINLFGAPEVPSFVFGILVVQAIFFFSFGLNQWLHYRGVGPWRDYAYGEKAFLVLSLAAKSALAWQIYGGSLAN